MNAHTPFDANQDWTNPYCRNSSNDPMVDALLGNAYHVVRTVYCNLGYLKHLYDLLNQYGMVICVQSEAELKNLTTEAKYARIYDKSPAGDRRVTDYLYVDDDRTGILPDDTTATGSWVKVATSGSSGESFGEGAYIPWVFNNGAAVGGETTIRVPEGTVGIPFIIVNGSMNYVGKGFEYDTETLTITLAQPLEIGDEVVCLLTGVPAIPGVPNINNWTQINWLYNNGAAVGGEQVIEVPYTFQDIPAVFKNGLRLVKGLATDSYTLDIENKRFILTEPLVTNDRLVAQIGGEVQVLSVPDHTIEEVARVSNVKDSEVILSTDTSQTLNGKKVVYSVNEQKSYGLPVLPTNVYIKSVSDGKLTYVPGNVVVDLLPAPSPVRNELASDIGASMIGINIPFPGGVSRTLMQRAEDCVSVRDFGAKGDGVTDDTAAFVTACAALQFAFEEDGIRRTLWVPDGSYRTSATINIHQNMTIECGLHVVFQNIGSNKSFPAVELFGGACRSRLGVIDSYGAGIRLRGNTHDVNFQTISNCTDGLVIRAGTGSKVDGTGTNNNLDNKITGIQIGKCTNGIVFEQNANELIQQGNEIRVNFVSETQNTVLFRNYDGFTHTKMSNWDSNFIELIAVDPLEIADSSMIRNSTPYGVPNVTLLVQGWCGGWVPDTGTICLIRGAFSVSTFKFNLAQRVGLDELVDAAGRSSLGSCSVDLCRFTNLGNASSFYQAVTPGSVFNGGIPLHQKKFRIRVSIPDINPGSVHGMAFSHVLSQVSDTARFTIVNADGAPTARNGLLFEVTDAGAEARGMVRIWCRNISGSILAARDVDLIIAAE